MFYFDLFQTDGEYRIKRRYEEQLASVNEELKKMKKENCKQRTVIEWLEGELSATKDEKFALQNKLTSIEQRIYTLLRHKGEFSKVFFFFTFLYVEFFVHFFVSLINFKI